MSIILVNLFDSSKAPGFNQAEGYEGKLQGQGD